MKINYKVFSKHAEKVAKNVTEARPVLKGVHHAENGTLTVTDTFRLYQARNVNAPKGVLLDAVTGDELTEVGNYPDTSNMFSDPQATDVELTITNVTQAKEVVKAMIMVGKVGGNKKERVAMRLVGKTAQLEGDPRVAVTYEMEGEADPNVNMHFSANFLLEALEMLSDMKAEQVILHWHGNQRPFTLSPGGTDDIRVLLLPWR